jgi:NADH:ubiquinone oxidoreductase subunit F (NADH-binding)
MRPCILAIALLLASLAPELTAQILEGSAPRTGTIVNQGGSYYNFSSGSGCDLKVAVWGFVRNPGRYNIPCETNLLELMSYCGGPMTGAKLNNVKVIRKGGVNRENEIKEVIEIDLEKYMNLTSTSIVAPELLLDPGDLVIVDGQERTPVDTVLRVSQVVVAITSVITAMVAVINISR